MENNIEEIRHSLSHIMAQAILNLYPKTKLGMGPAIENGFYYDFLLTKTLAPEDLQKIEAKMKEIILQNQKFTKKNISKLVAKKLFSAKGGSASGGKDQPFKLELIKDLPGKTVSIYTTEPDKKLQATSYKLQPFVDLCKGPHIKNTSEIKLDTFKLTKIAGAYWKGSEKNKMLTRIYGLAFSTKDELQKYITMQEEAEKRDHRILGQKLDLFCFSDLVGGGLPLYTPKGVAIKEELQKEVERICRGYGFQKVSCPSLTKIDLFEISGHAKKFNDELFRVSSPNGHSFALKPVQCPHHTQIYASKPRSYKDLPIKYMESDKQYRAEKTGEVGGLTRVYAITVEDGHTFCTREQVKDEIKAMVNIIKEFYSSIGLWGNHWISLSTRGKDFSKYIGEKKDWDLCEKILKEVSDEMNLGAIKCPGEAALYGPKLDFMFKDAIGKEVQIPTVQIDFATPKKFNLVYTDKDGKEKNPVMVHRAILGSYERFLALIIEHFAGAFPVWLSPVQVSIIPISEKHLEYANSIKQKLLENNIRLEIRDEAETLGKKIRTVEMQKVPYLLILGDKEIQAEAVSVRQRSKGDLGQMPLDKFIQQIIEEIKNKK
ncbi:MAG: threonine--tRNA ligase [Candidatus Staskawiczbacteria bacterium RIFOXYB2_FULL_32_9]|uniref:Threonine--tRNA ligase n=1 Tax=Candidatus Staskawiczbacteria bacterium RIFOXYD1_FULL_32_13 TaxID=1802234 RepID=A0A1G2JME7_9BACT|nr:MAG: Threonine-tRNA ligase [Parcubacteria group bacterium GW2011_GWC2_32_10]OGZ79282.1 MAG: threonine--tRNA ligase [Candidatus Staskawiczbacteria bacterium RIFOXYB1_FULL_32_11]OGZ83577.1 MAG: threonine--tRNA ligase [Candidatus Staskawiczbacteria bacterium RIFOXYB2_FULL_32_9]OGZ88315.1 MAG: threonine--tRNA ligase [Candidatus Staskawiczbacteria bacterium RIFOXYD1_FULL_32_13]